MRRYDEVKILGKSLSYYRANPVLLYPVLASVVTYVLGDRGIVSISQESMTPDAFGMNYSTMDFFYLLFTWLFVSFLIVLGLIAMSHTILTKGNCTMSDWLTGIREYFWKILNVSLVMYFGATMLNAAVSLLLHPYPYVIEGSVMNLILDATTLTLYACYAAIVFDAANLQSSISLGLDTVRGAGRTFLSFLFIFFGISEVRLFLGQDIWTPYSARITHPNLLASLATALTPQIAAYNVVSSFLSPLWFLIMFTTYCKYSHKPNQAKFCTECGNKLSPNSKLCDKCVTKYRKIPFIVISMILLFLFGGFFIRLLFLFLNLKP